MSKKGWLCVVGLIGVGIFSLSKAERAFIDGRGGVYKSIDEYIESWKELKKDHKGELSRSPGDTVFIGAFGDTSSPTGWYYPGRADGSLNLHWFVPPAECKLLKVWIKFYSPGDVDVYLWETPFPYVAGQLSEEVMDSIQKYWVYDTTFGMAESGWVELPPRTLTTADAMPLASVSSQDREARWASLDLTAFGGPIDVGMETFWLGVMNKDGSWDNWGRPWMLSNTDFGSYIPSVTYQFATGFHFQGTARPNLFRWLNYGDITGNWAVLMEVDMYGNPPPQISSSKKWITYNTGPFVIKCVITDNKEEVNGYVYWAVNPGIPPIEEYDSVALTGTYPNYEGVIDITVSPGDTIAYWIEAFDEQPRRAYWPIPGVSGKEYPVFFYIKERTQDVLLVDDRTLMYDRERGTSVGEVMFGDALNKLGIPYDTWTYPRHGDWEGPDSFVINAGYSTIIWATYSGIAFSRSLKWLAQFLDNGGNLFLIGQDALVGTYGYDSVATNPGEFVRDYFHFTWINDNAYMGETSPLQILGQEDDAVSGVFSETPIYYYISRNWIGTARTDGTPDVIFVDETDLPVGWKYASTKGFKWVFCYFEYAGIREENARENINWWTTRMFMHNVLNWFELPVTSLGVDPAVVRIVAPEDGATVERGSACSLRVDVNNYGFETIENMMVRCEVMEEGNIVYTDTMFLTGVEPNMFTTVELMPWTVPTIPDNESATYSINFIATATGDIDTINNIRQVTVVTPKGVEEKDTYISFSLFQNMPNPVVGKTLIRYAIPRREKVTLKLYNVVGQCVRTLVNEVQTPGVKEKYWDGRDDANRLAPSGVYFYKLEAGKNTATKKLILLR